jgi:hypothetical protein
MEKILAGFSKGPRQDRFLMATPMSPDSPSSSVDPPADRRWGLVAGVAGGMAVARAFDLWSTHALDSTLGGEQNLLHRLFGAGLVTLAVVNLAIVAFLAALFARSVRLDARVRPMEPGLGLGAFLSAFLFAGHHPWWHIVFRRPGRTRAKWVLGRMVPWPCVGISLLAFVGNVVSHLGEPFASGWAFLVGGPVRLLLTFAAYLLAVLGAWMLAEYGMYRHRTGVAVGGAAQGLENSLK